MLEKQPFEFVKTMTQYGMVLGSLIGFLAVIPVAILWFDISILLPVLALGVIISMCGGLIGMLYGMVSGFISGMLMTLTTRYIFRHMTVQKLYKVTMGLLALLTVAGVFYFDMLFIGGQQADFFTRSISLTNWYSVWILALIFAVYASQKTATEYLQFKFNK